MVALSRLTIVSFYTQWLNQLACWWRTNAIPKSKIVVTFTPLRKNPLSQSVLAPSYCCYQYHRQPRYHHRYFRCQSQGFHYKVKTNAQNQVPWFSEWEMVIYRSVIHGQTQMHPLYPIATGRSRYDTKDHVYLSIQGQPVARKHDQNIQNLEEYWYFPASGHLQTSS